MSLHALRSHLEQRRLVYVGLMAMISTGVMALGLWHWGYGIDSFVSPSHQTPCW